MQTVFGTMEAAFVVPAEAEVDAALAVMTVDVGLGILIYLFRDGSWIVSLSTNASRCG